MSIALDIELTKPIPIEMILPEASKALKAILGIATTPQMTAEIRGNSETDKSTSYLIEPASKEIGIRLINEPEVATVFPYTVDFPEVKTSIAISPTTWRTPLEVALVAAVAASLGEYLGELINDSAHFYTRELSQTADSFLERLKSHSHFKDYRLAAQEFYNRLPGT